MLDANLGAALRVPAYVADASTGRVVLDASAVAAVQPVAACILASAAQGARLSAKELVIEEWSPQLRQLLQGLDCPIIWGNQQPQVRATSVTAQAPTLAMSIPSRHTGNAVANELSARITAFIPSEDRSGVLSDEHSVRAYQAVEPALSYVLGDSLTTCSRMPSSARKRRAHGLRHSGTRPGISCELR